MASPLDGSIGLDTTFDQRFPASFDIFGGGSSPSASNANVVSQTKINETETVVGTEDTQSTTSRTETTTVGGAVTSWMVRGTVVILGLVFVAVGLSKFSGGGIVPKIP